MPDVTASAPIHGSHSVSTLPEVVIGRIVGIGSDHSPLVDWPGNVAAAPWPAISTVQLGPDRVGRSVALLFADGDRSRPLIVGLIHSPLEEVVEATQERSKETDSTTVDVQVDDDRLTLTADKEVVLKCGKASITLTRSGKVLVRGTYLMSRSSGANKIKGGSIELN